MANLKISQLTTYTGNVKDNRWFIMNNSTQTETFKFSGYTSPLRYADGTDSAVSANLPTNYAPDINMLIFGSHNNASSGQYSVVLGGRNNRVTNEFATVIGGLNNSANGSGSGIYASQECGLAAGAAYSCYNCDSTSGGFTQSFYSSNGSTFSFFNAESIAMIAGLSNNFEGNGVQASAQLGGRSLYWNQSDNRDPVIGAPRYAFGAMIGGYLNRIEGKTTSSAGAHAYPLLFGGKSNRLRGAESDDSATSGCTIINSYDSDIIGPSHVCGMFECLSSTISGKTGSVMIGTSGRTASQTYATHVENLVLFNYSNLNYSGDTAAAAGGVVLGQLYHDNGALRVRIV